MKYSIQKIISACGPYLLNVENVLESLKNMFKMSCNIGMPSSLYDTAALLLL
jgi:hypothetical protein